MQIVDSFRDDPAWDGAHTGDLIFLFGPASLRCNLFLAARSCRNGAGHSEARKLPVTTIAEQVVAKEDL